MVVVRHIPLFVRRLINGLQDAISLLCNRFRGLLPKFSRGDQGAMI